MIPASAGGNAWVIAWAASRNELAQPENRFKTRLTNTAAYFIWQNKFN